MAEYVDGELKLGWKRLTEAERAEVRRRAAILREAKRLHSNKVLALEFGVHEETIRSICNE